MIEFDGIQDVSKSDPSYAHISLHYSTNGGTVSSNEVTGATNSYSDADSGFLLRRGLSSQSVKIRYLPGQFQGGSSERIGWIYVYYGTSLTPAFEYSISSTLFDMFSDNAYIGFTSGFFFYFPFFMPVICLAS